MFEEHVTPFLRWLAAEHYHSRKISACRIVASQFVVYVTGRVHRPEDLTLEHVGGFLTTLSQVFPHFRQRPLRPGYQRYLGQAMSLFFAYLDRQGIHLGVPVPKKLDFKAVPGFEEMLGEFERFLAEHRGLSSKTVAAYLDHAARLCRMMLESGIASWDELSPNGLYGHLLQQAKFMRHLGLRNAQTALRALLRFLRMTGRCSKNLDSYLISYKTYLNPGVPAQVPDEELRRLFEDVRGNLATNIKDRAILMLLNLYGLRVGEIARLSLDDVRWREQTLLIRSRKAGGEMLLPLHPAAARALWEYIDRVRPPDAPHREVFLNLRSPHKPYLGGSSIGETLRNRIRGFGFRFSLHTMRHAFATRLINNDCPPEWIQQLLGHGRFSSTQIYTKVDMAHLNEVAENEGIRP